MHELTADLRHLERRGWVLAAWGPDDDGYDVHLHRPSTADRHGAEIQAFHEHQATAQRMAVVAAITADGHDLLRLLNEAYQALPHDATHLRERILQALMGASVPPVCAGAGQPTGPARPEADAAALDTTASTGAGREAA